MTTTATTPQEKNEYRFGKDELNLADWRISVPTHQQPRKADGGKLDLVEYEIPAANGTTQKVTLMAPAAVGLPTPADEDLLLALLCLAKEQNFAGDVVRFSTTKLCQVMRRSMNRGVGDLIEAGLTRLKALTIKYELAWYDKIKAKVEPVLITGIVAEAKLVRRKGRPRSNEPPDSYVQWTKNFFQTITAGSLTDIDLDLYFSFRRPGTKHLYRHLNKRFHNRREGERYERDLVHLACGHLGFTKSKFVKRNLQQCIRELEEHGYIRAEQESRYRKVRPGVWRVGFTLDDDYRKTRRSGAAAQRKPAERPASPALKLVRQFHATWSRAGDCNPGEKELAVAERLIEQFGEETIAAAMPRVVAVLRDKWPDCKTFKGVESYLGEAMRPLQEQRRRKAERDQAEEVADAERRRRDEKRRQQAELERRWQSLSHREQEAIRTEALRGHPVRVIQQRPSLAHSLCLAELRKRVEESEGPAASA